MPAVQRPYRTEYRDADPDVPTVSKENQLAPALVHRPIGRDQQVRPQQILVKFQRSLQICRTCLFFSLKNDLQIHRQRDLLRPKRIDCR